MRVFGDFFVKLPIWLPLPKVVSRAHDIPSMANLHQVEDAVMDLRRSHGVGGKQCSADSQFSLAPLYNVDLGYVHTSE